VCGGITHAESPECTPASRCVSRNAREEDLLAVVDRVDVDLERVFQELVHEDRTVR